MLPLHRSRVAAPAGATSLPRAALFPLVLLAAAAATAMPARAQAPVDSAAFVVRLGTDTLAIERWVLGPDRLDAVAVTRSPRTMLRRYSVRFDEAGRAVAFTVGDAAERPIEPAGAIPIAPGFQAPYALAVADAVRGGLAETRVTMLVGGNPREVVVRRLGEDRFEVPNQFGVPLQVTVGHDGAVHAIDAGGGSTVERTDWLDIEAAAREFASRDERGTGLGPLSPRDTVRTEINGTTITIDYSRPSARGRQVAGNLVPYDEVWRTGANDATRLVVDRDVIIGEVVLAPGSYSIFTRPGREGWDLIVNSQTGMSGLARDPARDVGSTTMQVRTLDEHVETFTIAVEPTVGGALLAIRWGNTEARVPVSVMK
jgi:hypothetical protein